MRNFDSLINLHRLADVYFDASFSEDSVFGWDLANNVRDAIVVLVERTWGVNISNKDWNIGGNKDCFTDIRVCIGYALLEKEGFPSIKPRQRYLDSLGLDDETMKYHGFKLENSNG
jgi:hypothetical protein